GAADTALRVAAAFADQRILYGKPATALPRVQELLVSAYADLLAADALMISCIRGIHVRPEELSVSSLIAKVMVPELTGRAIRLSGGSGRALLSSRGIRRGHLPEDAPRP